MREAIRPSELLELVSRTEVRRLRYLLQRLGHSGKVVPLSICLRVFVIEWLEHLGANALTDAQKFRVLAEIDELLVAFLAAAEAGTIRFDTPASFTLADLQWLTWRDSPRTEWISLDSDVRQTELPDVPVTLCICSLIGLWSRKLALYEALFHAESGGTDAGGDGTEAARRS